MAFKVTESTWLKTEGDRVESIIKMPKFWGVKWTHAKLRKALADIGELHTRGIVEDVPD
jgi:hypothetical protein